jgi:hypothetical protein
MSKKVGCKNEKHFLGLYNNNYEKEKRSNKKLGGLEKEFKNMQPIFEFEIFHSDLH